MWTVAKTNRQTNREITSPLQHYNKVAQVLASHVNVPQCQGLETYIR
jgi:hypothetical protein